MENDLDKDCKYCKVIAKKEERKGGIIFENEVVVAFLGSQHHKAHTSIVIKKHITDMLELTQWERDCFFNCMIMLAKAVKKAFNPDKLNYALLGNWVPHLHWHIYPRYKTDKDWGDPPEYGKKIIFSEKEMIELVQKIQESLNEDEMHKYHCSLGGMNKMAKYKCPKCGMEYEASGKCEMCDVELEEVKE